MSFIKVVGVSCISQIRTRACILGSCSDSWGKELDPADENVWLMTTVSLSLSRFREKIRTF